MLGATNYCLNNVRGEPGSNTTRESRPCDRRVAPRCNRLFQVRIVESADLRIAFQVGMLPDDDAGRVGGGNVVFRGVIRVPGEV